MRKTLIKIAVASMAMGIVGCESSGISARDPSGAHTDDYLSQLFNSGAADAPHEPERMKVPAHLAVAQIGELAPPEPMIIELRKSGAFSSVDAVPAPTDLKTTNDLAWYRSMAAAQKADYLLLIGGKADRLREPTPLSLLDITIIGMFIVPSQVMHTDVKAVGAIVNVRTGNSVALRTAEVKDSGIAPSALVGTSEIRLLEKARDEVAVKLGQAVVDETKR